MAQVNEVKYPAYKRLPNLLTNALNSIFTSTPRRVFQRIVQVVCLLRSTVAFALKIWLFGGKRSFKMLLAKIGFKVGLKSGGH